MLTKNTPNAVKFHETQRTERNSSHQIMAPETLFTSPFKNIADALALSQEQESQEQPTVALLKDNFTKTIKGSNFKKRNDTLPGLVKPSSEAKAKRTSVY
jgi:hypothetical protein